MKAVSITKLDKRTTATSKGFEDDVMLANYDVFFICFNLWLNEAIHKPDSGRMACNFFILFNSNPLSYKNWKQKVSNIGFILLFWVKVLFLPKCDYFFLAKTCWHQPNWQSPGTNKYIFLNNICVYSFLPSFKFLA